jgi:KAP family P-loop domain
MQQPLISLEITDRPSRRHQAVARALSFLIEATPREAMFGLFGHWGRGKSFIANLIGSQLTKSHHIVWFSAWRYPNVPECWAFLFQCIMKAIGETGPGGRVTLIRYNLRKHGMSHVLLLHLLVFFTIIGAYHQALWAKWLISILGLSLSLIVARIIWGARGRLGAIFNALVMPPSHREKLGLQEVLGDDLRMLINAWTGADTINMPRGRLIFALLLLSAVLPAIDIASSQETFSPLNWAHTARGEVWIAWSAVLLLFVALALYWPKTKSRVLLVLDDLDRCTTDVAQKLIESVALLLDEKSSNGQIHVLALIDDSVLLRATEFQAKRNEDLQLT